MKDLTRLMLSLSAVAATATAQLLAPAATPPPPPAAARAPAPAAVPVPPAAPTADPKSLVFDAESKEFNAKQGDTAAPFTFHVTNTSQQVISINRLTTSCGCTVAQLPSSPYALGAGSNVAINVNLDLRGKLGTITKSVSVDSAAGFKSLTVKAVIPTPPNADPTAAVAAAATPAMNDRAKNIQAALNDRQAIFKGDCRTCHVDKGIGKVGKELYDADCGVCHDAEHRAAMVPDLKVPRTQRDLAFWVKWVTEGKPGTMMPAFGTAHGGPLSPEQADSLAIYLYQTLPKTPPARAALAAPHAAPASVPPLPLKN